MAGGGSSRGSGGKKKARIEIIPLIDVIFFLLATFILFTLSLNKSGGVPLINYTTSETGDVRDPAGTATVSIHENGTLAWDQDDNITLQELINRLNQFHLQHPEADAHILINGDAEAPFSQIVYVFDEARKAQIKRVFIDTHSHPAGT